MIYAPDSALRDQISEWGREGRQWNNSSLNEEPRAKSGQDNNAKSY